MKKRRNKSWRNIKYAKGFRVSSDGRVKHNQTILKQNVNSNGQKTVVINHIGYSVDYLVANAFVKKPKEYNSLVHKDNSSSNNSYDNIEWRKIKIDSTSGRPKGHEKIVSLQQTHPIIGIQTKTLHVLIFTSVYKATLYGFTTYGLYKTLHHKQNDSGGYKWFYYEDIKDNINIFELYYQSQKNKVNYDVDFLK